MLYVLTKGPRRWRPVRFASFCSGLGIAFTSEPVRTCTPLCALIASFPKRLASTTRQGLWPGGFSWDRHFSVDLGEKWKVLNTVPKIWLTLF